MASKATSTIGKYVAKKIGNKTFDKAIQKISEPYERLKRKAFGILSFAKNPNADLRYYYKRTGGETSHSGIVKWMENCLEGRSRAIRGFSEPIQWTEKSINMFKPFIENTDLFSIDLDALQKDGLIEAVYVSPALRPNLNKDLPQDVDERMVKLASINDIDTSPVDWSVCDEKLSLRFSVVPYYLIVIKGGIIPPQYITLESK